MLEQTQAQHLKLTIELQKALHVLELPIGELAEWIQAEIDQNPALRTSDRVRAAPMYCEEAPHLPSLFEFLMEQARRSFRTKENLELAETIIGSLDGRGFLQTDEFEGAVLEEIRGFDPPGIAARSVQESLLIQLTLQGKSGSDAFTIIRDHYNDLLHGRYAAMQRALKVSKEKIQQIVAEEISPLDPHPGSRFSRVSAPSIAIDLTISSELRVEVVKKGLPSFDIDTRCAAPRSFVRSAKWLQTILMRRKETLEKVGRFLAQRNPKFFLGETKKLAQITLRELARSIALHDSTATRAVSGKWIECVQGILPLRAFFTGKNRQAEDLLATLISEEDKSRPLSDEALTTLLASHGIACSRRAVTKYRLGLGIPSSTRRKENHK